MIRTKIQKLVGANFIVYRRYRENTGRGALLSTSTPFPTILKMVNRYQIEFETSMGGSDFIFDGVHLLCFKCHKINFKPRRSYIDSPKRLSISFNSR